MQFKSSVIASITLLSYFSSLTKATTPCPESSVAPHVATPTPTPVIIVDPIPTETPTPTPTPIYEDIPYDEDYEEELPQAAEYEEASPDLNGGLKLTMSAVYGLAVLFAF